MNNCLSVSMTGLFDRDVDLGTLPNVCLVTVIVLMLTHNWSLEAQVSNIIRRYIYIYRSHEVCCLYGFFVYHIPSCSFGSFSNHCVSGCMFCMLLFSFVSYVFLLLCMLCT